MKTRICCLTAVVVVCTGSLFACTLVQTATPDQSASAMSTMTDVYNCIDKGNCPDKRTGTFVEPASGPTTGTGKTLDDLMVVAKHRSRPPKTGQTTSYGTGDDGAKQRGVAWPSPRFIDNGNGTVTDNLTGLIWLKNANCFGSQTWSNALTSCNNLANGACGLSDDSITGDWRLPSRFEIETLLDMSRANPTILSGHPFTNVKNDWYWTGTSYVQNTSDAWQVALTDGYLTRDSKTQPHFFWPVRGGQ